MIKNSKNPWKTLSSKIVYKSSFIKVIENKVIKPDKQKGFYSFVSIPRTVGIVPMDKDNDIYLCKQFRYIFKDQSWEIPRGFVEETESIINGAKRELLEEGGLIAKKLINIGSIRTSIGLLDEEAKIFLAIDVFKSPTKDSSFEIKQAKKFKLKEVLSMIEKNKIRDGLTIGAIFKTKQKLNLD